MRGHKSVLLTCWGTFGELIPVFRLAKQLSGQGKAVHICGPAYSRPLFERHFASFNVMPSSLERPNFRPDDRERYFSRRTSLEAVFEDIDEHITQSVSLIHGLIVREKIDEVIHSWVTPAGALAAQKAGVSSARLFIYPLALNQEADPPVMHRWPSIATASWSIETRRKLRLRVSQHYRRLMPRTAELAAALGAEPDTYEMMTDARPSAVRLATFDRRLLLAKEEGLDFLKLPALPESRLVPSALQDFLDRHGPPILISLGSIMALSKQKAISRLVKAAHQLSLPAVVVLGQPGPQQSKEYDRTIVLNECPLPAVLPFCRLSVHHGGIGSVQETLEAGRVSLTVPLQTDQFDNARRLRVLELGYTAPLDRLDDTALSSLMETALNDKETEARCRGWQAQGQS